MFRQIQMEERGKAEELELRKYRSSSRRAE